MSSNNVSARGAQIKKKQMLVLVAGAGIFMLLALGATYVMTSNQKPQAPVDKPAAPINLVTAGGAYSEREAWRTQLGTDVANIQKQFQELQKQLGDREAARQADARRGADRAHDLSPPAGPGGASAPQGSPGTGDGRLAAVPPPPPLSLPPAPPGGAKKGAGSPLFSGGPLDPPAGALGGQPKDAIATVTFDDPAKKAGAKLQPVDGESGGTNATQKAGAYIPAGTFARIVVLNGLDAPTGGQSQANPTPVLLQVKGPATLPNGFRVDMSECIALGNGVGDVASERAAIRLDRLSCIAPGGGAIDIQVRGYVAGEDGKAGMRGKLVTKTGQILANALLASIGSGIGEAFKSAAETTTQNALGTTTTTTTPGEGFQKGFGTGTQRAFDMLARYYIQLAEKTFPIVEVQGGRVADIVFTRGFMLESASQ